MKASANEDIGHVSHPNMTVEALPRITLQLTLSHCLLGIPEPMSLTQPGILTARLGHVLWTLQRCTTDECGALLACTESVEGSARGLVHPIIDKVLTRFIVTSSQGGMAHGSICSRSHHQADFRMRIP